LSGIGDPIYVDTSALVKLVIDEPESESLAAQLVESGLTLTSSELAEVELLRAVARSGPDRIREANGLLRRTLLLPMTREIRKRAASIKPVSVRSLDAVHLATAIEIQADLHSLLSYDAGLLAAAQGAGIAVSSPGA